jgi:LPPG:FO 2-phospho-L-lactate transferase
VNEEPSTATAVCVLCGGVGAARFLSGLVEVIPARRITAIINTGDDEELYGLHVSPDIDIVTYTLGGLVDEARGWGLNGDSFNCVDFLARYGHPTWFRLGDRDLATCLFRTMLLSGGYPLSTITDRIRRSLGVEVGLLPMSDQRVRTKVLTAHGPLAFQEYFVHRGQQDEVTGVQFEGIDEARPAPGVLEALSEAEVIVVAPSNPFVSIGPILAVPGLRACLLERRQRVAAISPIIGGEAVKGPAARMLASMGSEVSAWGVAALYRDLVSTFILDSVDEALAPRIAELGMRPLPVRTLMQNRADRRDLAEQTLRVMQTGSSERP